MPQYHCEDCIWLSADDHPEVTAHTCTLTGKIVSFDPSTKTPCKGFHPEEYIRALNADSTTRD